MLFFVVVAVAVFVALFYFVCVFALSNLFKQLFIIVVRRKSSRLVAQCRDSVVFDFLFIFLN